jgi:RimJ/RimL family protein N-acetyltransferase
MLRSCYAAGMTPSIPTLLTPRLILRALQADDLDAFAAMHANPEVMRTLGTGVTRSRAETWDGMARMLGQWALRGYGMFAVVESGSGRFIGRAGILHPYEWEEPELAYGFDQPYWGRGYATEAATILHRWAFLPMTMPSLVSYVLPGNQRSRRVLEKLGATNTGPVMLFGTTEAECWRHRTPG